MKVFLGGTCAGTIWREALIPMLKCDYFDPVVDDWTEECMAEEIRQREECDYCLYVITPSMQGVYSIAEVVDDSNKRPKKTILCILNRDVLPGEIGGRIKTKNISFGKTFSEHELKSLAQVVKMVEKNGAVYFDNLEAVADFLNGAQFAKARNDLINRIKTIRGKEK